MCGWLVRGEWVLAEIIHRNSILIDGKSEPVNAGVSQETKYAKKNRILRGESVS